jgi:DNA helicase-2/ATP-dependent DNA helicase PcrA
LLKIYAPLLGYKNTFTVLDSDDSEALLKLCIKEFKNDATGKRFPSASVVQNIISFSRNSERPIAEVLRDKFEQHYAWEAEILHIAKQYEVRKKASQAMDFDDLLTNTLLLVRAPQVREKYAKQFKYILVDEYQDTNKIQASIIRELASVHNNVLVVGDDAQSIYSFRAADIENILNFEKQYQGAKIFKLEVNYRSTKPILDVANSVISYNSHQFEKNLHPLDRRGTDAAVSPVLAPQMDQQAEANFIGRKIEELLKQGVSAPEIAVLFRAAFHSQALEVELVSRGISYDYRGGVRFF